MILSSSVARPIEGTSAAVRPVPRVEWPTLLVGVAALSAWGSVVVSTRQLGPVAATVMLGVVLAWWGSFQHEVIHGHPTRSQVLNDLLGFVPLNPWLPYLDYKTNHLAHHLNDNDHLTNPFHDPEAWYQTADAQSRRSAVSRVLFSANRTLLGRLTVGPGLFAAGYLFSQFRRTDRLRTIAVWVPHLVASCAVLWLATGLGHIPMWAYPISMYLAVSLTFLRSFAEHRYEPTGYPRTAVVECGRFWSLLFLNNNLHLAHHERAGVPWYQLPELARTTEAAARASIGAGHYPGGYFEVARRYALRPFLPLVHPDDPSSPRP